MDAFLEALGSTVKELLPAALIFAALAVILKRDKVWLRSWRRGARSAPISA